MGIIYEFFAGAAAITIICIFLGKIIINKLADSVVERYKNELQKDTEQFRYSLNLKTEEFKNELNLTAIEHQVRYSKLYEERGEIIKKMYNLLLDLGESMLMLTTEHQGKDWGKDPEREGNVDNAINDLRQHLEQNRLFFSIELCNKIESILNSSKKIKIDFFTIRLNDDLNREKSNQGIDISANTLLAPYQEWRKLYKKVENEIRAAIYDVAQEFRILIGVVKS